MRLIPLLLSSILFVACSQSAPDAVETEANTKYALKVRGMTCESGCKKLIETKMAKHPGIVDFDIDFNGSMAVVKFDERLTDTTAIREAIGAINSGAYSAVGLPEYYEKN